MAKVPTHIKDQARDLYNQGLSITKICQKLPISEPTLSRYLKETDTPIRLDNGCKIALDPIEIQRLYDEDPNPSTYKLAKQFGCSDETIRKIIITKPNIGRTHTQDTKTKISEKSSGLWQNEEYKIKVKSRTSTPEYKAALSEASKKHYQSGLGQWIQTTEARLKISESLQNKWRDEAYRSKQQIWYQERVERIVAASKLALSDPKTRQEWLHKLKVNNANRPIKDGWISTAQKQLYFILDYSGINYHEEGHDTVVGPFYRVDCIIPCQQKMQRPLIIEVQGEYWHNLPHVKLKDRQKATYIKNHTDYDLLCLEELDLASFGEVESKLNSFGLELRSLYCRPKELEIKRISEQEASLFYSVFHYTGTIRKGATAFGAFYQDQLIAAISYTSPRTRESATRLGCSMDEVMEISRLARQTNLYCKNLASYLISNTQKLLPKKVKKLISFSDKTYGHTGTVYKAAGFKLDGEIGPDYHYISLHGRYHKKTIWDKAKRFKMSEKDYASKHGLVKVITKEKNRWVLER